MLQRTFSVRVWQRNHFSAMQTQKEAEGFPSGHAAPLTQGTEPQRVPLRWGGWPALLPPPWAAWWPACGASPGGTSRASAPCTCAGGWWCAARCAGSPAWRRRERPPWNSPGSCKIRAESEIQSTAPTPSLRSTYVQMMYVKRALAQEVQWEKAFLPCEAPNHAEFIIN